MKMKHKMAEKPYMIPEEQLIPFQQFIKTKPKNDGIFISIRDSR